MRAIWILIMFGLMFLGANGKEDTLKKLQVIFRHGYRYPVPLPLTTNDTCPKTDALKLGSLTNMGKSQMTLLGYFLRIHYNNFIGSDLSQIQVNYSDCYRDKESAQIVYEALFKNFNDTKLPDVGIINKTIEGDQCQSLNRSEIPSCNYMYRSDLGDVSDQIIVEETEGCTIPTWITPESRDLFLTAFKIFFQSIPLCQCKDYVESVSDEMLKWINVVFDPKNDRKYKNTYLYTSYDVNIATILIRMGVFNSLPVPFGAALIFEQHSIDNGTVIRIFYDNSTDYSNFQRLKFPGCNLDCPYESFVKIITGSYPCPFSLFSEPPDIVTGSFAVRPEALGIVTTVIMSLMLGWLLY